MVSRLHSHTDGRLTCNIIVTTSDPDCKPHLLQTAFNLTAHRSRSELKKILHERYSKPVDWDSILESMCVQSMQQFEAGEPVVELFIDSEAESKPPEFLIYPLVPKYKPTIFFGDGSCYKSSLSRLFSVLLTLPLVDNDLKLRVSPNSERVLLLDWEADEDEAKSQLLSILKGLHLGIGLGVNYRSCHLPLAQDIEAVAARIDEAKATVLVIDSLGPAAGGELNSSLSSVGFYNALRSLRAADGKPLTTIIVAHNAKNPMEKRKTTYGSTFFTNLARYIWEVTKVQETGSDDADICLYHRKTNITKLFKPLSFHIHHNSEGMSFTRQDASAIGEFAKNLSLPDRILAVLKEGNFSAAIIKEEIELEEKEEGAFRKALYRLCGNGGKKLIIHLADDTYGLLLKDKYYEP